MVGGVKEKVRYSVWVGVDHNVEREVKVSGREGSEVLLSVRRWEDYE